MVGQDSFRVDKLRQLMEFPFAGHGLTEELAKVARLAAFGWTIDEIAAELGINRNQAGSKMRLVRKKTGFGKFGLTRDLVKRIEEVLK